MRWILIGLVLFLILSPVSVNAQISYWSFDNSIDPGKDSVGGNDCTLTNDPAWTPNGFNKSAIIFEGVDDYLNCGNDSTLNFGTGNFSVSFWFKKGEAGDKYESILYKATPRQASAGYGFLLRETGGQLKFTIGNGTRIVQAVGPNVPDTNWHFAVGMRGGGKIKLYLDNQLVAEGNDTIGSIDTNENFVVGMGGYGNNPGGPYVALYFRGKIDEVKIFNRSLIGGEINQSYYDGWASHREPPVIILNSPADGETNLSTSPVLNVTVIDPDGDLMDVSFYGSSTSAILDNFTIIALPDTQNYVRQDTGNYSHIFTNQTQWIADNKDRLNIVFVTHEGDIVEHWDNIEEWEYANSSMSILNGVVPWGVLPGNHDQEDRYNFPHNAYYYNQYFNYTRFEQYSWYGGYYGDNNDNNYQLFSAGGMNFIIIHLEQNPSSGALSWANELLSNHSDRRGIVDSHYIIGRDGSRGSVGNNIYNALKDNPSLFLMLCGHVPGEGRRTDVINNNTIHSLLSDYQSMQQGGSGYLRIMTFSPKENKIYVKTYSPYLNRYETDSDSQFTLDYTMTDYNEIGTNYGVVNGSYTTVTWNNLDNNTKYYWYVRAVDSNSQIGESEFWKFVSGFIIPVSIPGDLNNDGEVDIGDLVMIAMHFGKTRSHPKWNETANLVTDNEIDVYDVVYVASRFT